MQEESLRFNAYPVIESELNMYLVHVEADFAPRFVNIGSSSWEMESASKKGSCVKVYKVLGLLIQEYLGIFELFESLPNLVQNSFKNL